MKYIATFDFGTTAVKGALVNTHGELVTLDSVNLSLLLDNGYVEQDPAEWESAFREISARFFEKVEPSDIAGLIMSGQMQDAIFVDENANALGNAILYQDGRAQEEYETVINAIDPDSLEQSICNAYTPTLVAPKIAWVRKHDPEKYRKAAKVLFSPKDLINAQLTGTFAADATTSSTVGAMKMKERVWDEAVLNALELDASLFPPICLPHEQIGTITEEGAARYGYAAGMPVFCGIGDAGATFFASGIIREGEYSITIGTTGMVGLVANAPTRPLNGLWNLAAMEDGTYIHTVPFLNAGNVHKWISSLLTPEDKLAAEGIDYAAVTAMLEQPHSRSGLICLPFLTGERFPVVDPNVKGCLIGLTPATTKADLAKACLEGVCFSLKQGLETMRIPTVKMILVGGAGRVAPWCQMLADILEMNVTVLEHSDVLPSMAIAAGALRTLGLLDAYEPFVREIQEKNGSKEYMPSAELQDYYRGCYETYKQIYPAVHGLFAE